MIDATKDPSGVDEQNESLWMITLSPSIWATHFLLSYLTAAVWCEKFAGPDGSLSGARAAIWVYTAVALISIALVGGWGWARYRRMPETVPMGNDSRKARYRFLGYATLLLSILSAVATLFVGMTSYFIGDCN